MSVAFVVALMLPEVSYAQLDAAAMARAQRNGENTNIYGSTIPGMEGTGMEGEEGMEDADTTATKKKRERKPLESYYFTDTVRALPNWKWNVDRYYNRVNIMPLDTTLSDWRIDYVFYRKGVGDMALGGLGQSSQPVNWFDRSQDRDFTFARGYDAYTARIENVPFYNSKKPLTNLTYLESGQKRYREEHFEIMRPLMKMLADAGQKVITATLNRDPWRYQCFDDYEPMIYWYRYDNDEWKYDYSRFDKWVEFMMSLGVDKQINCYGMLPWGSCTLDYQDMRSDAKDNRLRQINTTPQEPEYEKVWGPFLTDFAKHLKEKGWLHITNIAIDERAPEDMDVAARLIAKYAPELGFAMADNHDSYKRYTNMRDVCVGQKHSLMSHDEILARRAKGDVSTFYVCCSTLFPNAFTNSQPFESELLILYALAHDYDGMLRWAYNSWPARPEYDSRFRRWASGDTFFIYPHARNLAPNLLAEDGSVGIRITTEPFSKALCEQLRRPIVSTSANISGEAAAKCFNDITPELLNAVDYVCEFRRNDTSTHQPSSIIKIDDKERINIIRK